MSETRILRVRANSISFGCMQAEDLSRNAATILLYETIGRAHTRSGVPSKGDYLLCRPYHSSTFIILFKVRPEHVVLHSLPIAHDIVHSYFPTLS